MKKVLIIGPNFRYFTHSIAQSFEQTGLQTSIIQYDAPIHPYNTANKIWFKIAKIKHSWKENVLTNNRIKNSQYAIAEFDKLQPDLVFILNSDYLLPTAIQHFKQTAYVAIWLYDDIRKFEFALHNLPLANTIFCYDKSDVELLQEKYHINAHFLPQGAETALYYPIENTPKIYDISFAGDIWNSPRRIHILQTIVRTFPNLKIKIYGIYKPWYKNFFAWLTRERKDIYTNHNTTPQELNLLYNQSRIVLNIHGADDEQEHYRANPRFFEILASGAYQICDNVPYVRELFPNGEIGLYNNTDELIELIKNALHNNPSVQNAHQEIMKNHTLQKRIEQALAIINQEK